MGFAQRNSSAAQSLHYRGNERLKISEFFKKFTLVSMKTGDKRENWLQEFS